MSYNQTIDTNNKVKELLTTESIMLLVYCFSVPCILLTIWISTIFCKPAKEVYVISPSPEEVEGSVDEFDMPSENFMDYCHQM